MFTTLAEVHIPNLHHFTSKPAFTADGTGAIHHHDAGH